MFMCLCIHSLIGLNTGLKMSVELKPSSKEDPSEEDVLMEGKMKSLEISDKDSGHKLKRELGLFNGASIIIGIIVGSGAWGKFC